MGPTGKVYATDIQQGMLELLQRNVARAKLDNVVPVLGAPDDPKLPAAPSTQPPFLLRIVPIRRFCLTV